MYILNNNNILIIYILNKMQLPIYKILIYSNEIFFILEIKTNTKIDTYKNVT